jgi:hypothetical protein
MKAAVKIAPTVTVHVPMTFALRGGRKEIISAVLQPSAGPVHPRSNNALLKALARAHRWRASIEAGEHASVTELAKAENVNQSYACRLLRLTLLAPDILVKVLNGSYTSELMLKKFMKPFPVEWDKQLTAFRRDGCA